jgi:hypothetical protein
MLTKHLALHELPVPVKQKNPIPKERDFYLIRLMFFLDIFYDKLKSFAAERIGVSSSDIKIVTTAPYVNAVLKVSVFK